MKRGIEGLLKGFWKDISKNKQKDFFVEMQRNPFVLMKIFVYLVLKVEQLVSKYRFTLSPLTSIDLALQILLEL